jgi:nitroreductase
MTLNPKELSELIANRRSIFPNMYNNEPISDEMIWEILNAANWAPNHRKTEPWRFKVFRKQALERLSIYLSDYYEKHTPAEKFSQRKYDKTKGKPLRSDCVIAICMQRNQEELVPEWEEIAALGCAVQNMWLSCTANGIGAYWSSPASATNAQSFLELGEGERCLGLFYMGNWDQIEVKSDRKSPIEDKVVWMEK